MPELKVDPNAPEPGAERLKKGDEHKKKFEAEPKEEDQKKLKQKKPDSAPEFKIEEDAFDDAEVAEHIKADPKKEKKEKEEKKLKDMGLDEETIKALKLKEGKGGELSEKQKDPDAPIKSTKDLHEELIKNIRDSDSSLRIEVSSLNDDEIDEQIEAHKESLKIAEMRRTSAEAAAKRIKEEDEAEEKAAKAALVEKQNKDRLNQDYTISTSKLEEG